MESLDNSDEGYKRSDTFLGPSKPTEPDIEYKTKHERCKSEVEKMLHSKAFHIAIVVLCILDGLLVIAMLLLEIETLKLKPGKVRDGIVLTSFIFECMSLTIVSVFLLEIPVKVWVLGFGFYCRHWVELVDLLVCVVSFAVDVYNIQRHIEHEKHEKSMAAHSPSHEISAADNQAESIQETIADAAGLLVLFRLWRVVRIVNAIVVTVTESHESQVRHMKLAQHIADRRIHHLEQALWERGIPIPPMSKEEEEFEQHQHHQHHHSHQRHNLLENQSPRHDWELQSKHISVYENT